MERGRRRMRMIIEMWRGRDKRERKGLEWRGIK